VPGCDQSEVLRVRCRIPATGEERLSLGAPRSHGRCPAARRHDAGSSRTRVACRARDWAACAVGAPVQRGPSRASRALQAGGVGSSPSRRIGRRIFRRSSVIGNRRSAPRRRPPCGHPPARRHRFRVSDARAPGSPGTAARSARSCGRRPAGDRPADVIRPPGHSLPRSPQIPRAEPCTNAVTRPPCSTTARTCSVSSAISSANRGVVFTE